MEGSNWQRCFSGENRERRRPLSSQRCPPAASCCAWISGSLGTRRRQSAVFQNTWMAPHGPWSGSVSPPGPWLTTMTPHCASPMANDIFFCPTGTIPLAIRRQSTGVWQWLPVAPNVFLNRSGPCKGGCDTHHHFYVHLPKHCLDSFTSSRLVSVVRLISSSLILLLHALLFGHRSVA